MGRSRLRGRCFPLSARRAPPDAAGFGSSLSPARADGAAKAHAVRPAASASSALFRRRVRLGMGRRAGAAGALRPAASAHAPRRARASRLSADDGALRGQRIFRASSGAFPASARPLSQGRANSGRLRGLRRGAAPRRVSQPARPCAAAFRFAALAGRAAAVPRAESSGNRTHPAQRSRTRAASAPRAGSVCAPVDHAAPGAAMLVACGGCMLGFLEPDEAARQMTALLPDLSSVPLDAHETACALAAAQAIRERMADCDAALRSLPAQIERACAPEGPPRRGWPIFWMAHRRAARCSCPCAGFASPRSSPIRTGFWPCRIKQKRPTMRGRF